MRTVLVMAQTVLIGVTGLWSVRRGSLKGRPLWVGSVFTARLALRRASAAVPSRNQAASSTRPEVFASHG